MLNFVYLHLGLVVVYGICKLKTLKIMKDNYCTLALWVIFIILVFALNDVWQLIAFLLLVLLTLPVAVNMVSDAVTRYQENKITLWFRKSDDDLADNFHQIVYAIKMAFIWIALLVCVIVFAGGSIAALGFAIGLFFDWCNIVLLIYTLIYLTLVILRTTMKALFE